MLHSQVAARCKFCRFCQPARRSNRAAAVGLSESVQVVKSLPVTRNPRMLTSPVVAQGVSPAR